MSQCLTITLISINFWFLLYFLSYSFFTDCCISAIAWGLNWLLWPSTFHQIRSGYPVRIQSLWEARCREKRSGVFYFSNFFLSTITSKPHSFFPNWEAIGSLSPPCIAYCSLCPFNLLSSCPNMPSHYFAIRSTSVLTCHFQIPVPPTPFLIDSGEPRDT